MMSEVVSRVTWQRWKACDLGNNNHIAQALLTEEQRLAAWESPGSSQSLLREASKHAVTPIWNGAHDPKCRPWVLLEDKLEEPRKGTGLWTYQETRAPTRFCSMCSPGQIHRNEFSLHIVWSPKSVSLFSIPSTVRGERWAEWWLQNLF